MLFWCVVLCILGIYGILEEILIMHHAGGSGRAVTWALMFTVLGMLVHVRSKEKTMEKERLKARVEELERALKELRLRR
ncbi:MAG: hypothetical protein IT574_08760 [Candidatus Aureabacteria bacterium]|nr:hypothetical protein [Candidatus Auribacterota bacterium]NLW93811.1 hypothetical protein [Chlamydiota bacterium]HOE26488.1 hypothetical protein [bacterium]HQM52977.1 hypothetical protein [bacterium]